MKRTAPLLLIFALAACGSQKAVRPTAPAPVVAETQTYTIDYKAASRLCMSTATARLP